MTESVITGSETLIISGDKSKIPQIITVGKSYG